MINHIKREKFSVYQISHTWIYVAFYMTLYITSIDWRVYGCLEKLHLAKMYINNLACWTKNLY